MYDRQNLNINDLNIDVLFIIFDNLSVKELLAIERVCKLWQSFVLSRLSLRKSLTTIYNDVTKFNSYFPLCSQQSHWPYKASIGQAFNRGFVFNIPTLNIEKLKIILIKCPNIESLYLSTQLVLPSHLDIIFECCQRLECLSFKTNHIDWIETLTKYQHRLKHLRIESTQNIIVPHMPNIRELTILNAEQD